MCSCTSMPCTVCPSARSMTMCLPAPLMMDAFLSGTPASRQVQVRAEGMYAPVKLIDGDNKNKYLLYNNAWLLHVLPMLRAARVELQHFPNIWINQISNSNLGYDLLLTHGTTVYTFKLTID